MAGSPSIGGSGELKIQSWDGTIKTKSSMTLYSGSTVRDMLIDVYGALPERSGCTLLGVEEGLKSDGESELMANAEGDFYALDDSVAGLVGKAKTFSEVWQTPNKKIKQIFVDGETYDIGGDALPEGGNTGDVLTKTDSGAEWKPDIHCAEFDAIIATDGTGDYLTIGDAINAGKCSLFIKNGTYTETKSWDLYSKSKSFLRLEGESKGGVTINIPNTLWGSSQYFVNMRYGEADFHMKELTLNINLPGKTFYSDTKTKCFFVDNCIINYDSTSTGLLFSVNGLSNDNVYKDKKGLGFYNCEFYTENVAGSYSGGIHITEKGFIGRSCKFKSVNGCIDFDTDYRVYLEDCRVDSKEFCARELELLSSHIFVTQLYGYEGQSSMEVLVTDSTLSITNYASSWTSLQVTGVNSNIVVPTHIVTGNQDGNNKSIGALGCYIEGTRVSGSMANCRIKAPEVGVSNGGVTGCYINTDYVNISSGYLPFTGNRVTTNSASNIRIYIGTASIVSNNTFQKPIAVESIRQYGSFCNNTVYSASSGTIDISYSYTSVCGNVFKGISKTGTGAGGVYANNVV